MRKRTKSLAALALLAATLTASGALAVTYECELEANTRFGWIPPRLFLILSEDGNQALAYDGLIHNSYGEPIPAAVKHRNANSVQFSWEVEHMQISNRRNTISGDFIATLNTARMTITMRVFLKGADFDNRGSGTCEIMK